MRTDNHFTRFRGYFCIAKVLPNERDIHTCLCNYCNILTFALLNGLAVAVFATVDYTELIYIWFVLFFSARSLCIHMKKNGNGKLFIAVSSFSSSVLLHFCFTSFDVNLRNSEVGGELWAHVEDRSH